MKKNLKSLEKQIAKLEQDFFPPPHPKRKMTTYQVLNPAVRNSLAPNERIVEDHYLGSDAVTVLWIERVTADPTDMGKDFPHGSWDRRKFDAYNRRPRQIRAISWGPKTRAVVATQDLKREEQIDAQESLDSDLVKQAECDPLAP